MSVPKPGQGDTYGARACKFMLRMTEIGVDAAIAEEIDNPSSFEPGWCAMVVDLVQSRAMKAATQT